MDLESEVVLADLALIGVSGSAGTFPGVLELVDAFAIEGDQADALGQELVVQHRCVFVYID